MRAPKTFVSWLKWSNELGDSGVPIVPRQAKGEDERCQLGYMVGLPRAAKGFRPGSFEDVWTRITILNNDE